jgi:type IV pilus assembly protein PilA
MKRRGFTLVEIMIVVAIIALLAAIAIPSLLSARKTANEAAAKANTRTLMTGYEASAAANNGTYPANLAALQIYVKVADQLCGKTTGGYTYACTYGSTYAVTATPESATTGSKKYTASAGGELKEEAWSPPAAE